MEERFEFFHYYLGGHLLRLSYKSVYLDSKLSIRFSDPYSYQFEKDTSYFRDFNSTGDQVIAVKPERMHVNGFIEDQAQSIATGLPLSQIPATKTPSKVQGQTIKMKLPNVDLS